uniref:V-type proton ATPase subunit a n=1 Tax=Globodera pallida TaxID=36090 RepID=A0A183CMT8_GLOPA
MATKTDANFAHLLTAIDGYIEMNPDDSSMVELRILVQADRTALQNELLLLQQKRSAVDEITSSRANSSPSKQKRREWDEAFRFYVVQFDAVRAFLQSLTSSTHLKRLKRVLGPEYLADMERDLVLPR